jgi:hypothetical protein
MNKKRISEIFSDDRFTLYAVESVEVSHTKTATGFTWHGNVKPAAIIIHSPGKNQALDMDANPIELKKLKESIPELDRIKGL